MVALQLEWYSAHFRLLSESERRNSGIFGRSMFLELFLQVSILKKCHEDVLNSV